MPEMLSLFNRRELITVMSQKQLGRVQAALHDAGIINRVKFSNGARAAGHGRRSMVGMNVDAMYIYKVYVSKEDYGHAKAAVQLALQGF